MSKINVLSSKIYNRIAAGEVVERPASVVKELVENSIDAGCSEITVEIARGGMSSIKVIDNGVGIERLEIKKTIMPHATSKISAISDLDAISTLGFRGEALASIAAVSKLTIVSKTEADETGVMLYAEGGENVTITDHPAVTGTEITVDNLFFNTPAREKFLKSDKSEEGEVSNLVARFILGNPDIAFTYKVDGKTYYQSFGDGEESAFISIYGINSITDCFYVDTVKNGITVKGYIGKHYFTKPNRSYQSVFLNGRYIINSTISSAITNAYSAYLMKRQYPFYVLSISMPKETVDVNVHPNKIDVRFSNNQIIYGAVYSAVSKVLDGTSEALDIVSEKFDTNAKFDMSVKFGERPDTFDKSDEEDKEQRKYKALEGLTDVNKIDLAHPKYKNNKGMFKRGDFSCNKVVFRDSESEKTVSETDGYTEKTESKDNVVDIFAENKAYLEKLERDKKARENAAKPLQTAIKIERELKYIGQALNTFLIFDDGEDVYFIDQHAAHERILFDKFTEQMKNNAIDTQKMLLPYVFDVSPAEADFLVRNLPTINAMGVEIEEFGMQTFKVSAVPVILGDIDLKDFFAEILTDLDFIRSTEITDILKDKIAQKACKAAIKAGDKLNEDDIKYILKAINADLGLKCPHGRPIAVRITRTEIDKWFKRIV